MVFRSTMIDTDLIYWIDQMGYEIVKEEELLDYVKKNFIRTQREVVEEYVEIMEVNIQDIFLLDWDAICNISDDYEELEDGRYLNRYLLEEESLELKRLDLII